MVGPVLIVEDDELSARLFIDLLEIDGWRWLLDADGTQAVDLSRRYCPALVVMDIRLSGASAFDLIRLLKDAPQTSGIPILVVTACVMPDEVAAVRATGINEYMAKPISIAAFRQAVERLARRSETTVGTHHREEK